MLQHYFFYATGHETSFTHIKWEAGFHGFEGDNKNSFNKIIIMILILTNTFSSIYVISIGGFGLLNYHDLFKNEKLPDLRNKIISSTLKFYLYNAIKVRSVFLYIFLNC